MAVLNIGRGSKRYQKRREIPALRNSETDERLGKTVFFEHEGQSIAGVIRVVDPAYKTVMVDVALPDASGILHKTGSLLSLPIDSTIDASNSVISEEDIMVKAWEADFLLRWDDDKQPTPVRSGADGKGPIIDYRDVRIEGFLSTFANTTPEDRDGEFVHDDAFKSTLADFKRNPVMLTDHTNSVEALVGSFDKIGVNPQGLAISGRLSNAPGLIDVRFKVAEGHLKALSMGGIFFYDKSGRGIEKVDLYEGSLTPVPANQDTLFQVRSLTIVDAAKAMKRYVRKAT